MHLIDRMQFWIDVVLYYGLLLLRVWAVVDCATRKATAFQAANKLTKPAWLLILVISAALGSLFAPLDILPLITVVVAAVYLADVRPAVRDISGGRW